MKRLNKFPRKLRNYTCIALVVGVLGWSGSGVGQEYYYNGRGQASTNKVSGPNFPFENSPSSSDSQTEEKNKDKTSEIGNPVMPPGREGSAGQAPNSSEILKPNTTEGSSNNPTSGEAGKGSDGKDPTPNSSGASGGNGPSFASPIMNSGCDTDADCKAQITGGQAYDGICCLKKQDSDAIGRAGFCVDSKKTCESMSKPPGGDPPSGDNPSPPSNAGDGDSGAAGCREDKNCNHLDCGDSNLVGWPECKDGNCSCKYLSQFECRNDGDCAAWYGKPWDPKSPGCDSAKNFKCEGATKLKYGQCQCQSGDQSSGGDSCASKRCGDPCSGCKRDEQLSGDCTCVPVKGTEGLTCLQADLPNCSSGS